MSQDIADVIRSCFISPNEMDRNFENANVVDGLFAIARGLQSIATAIDSGNGTAHPLMGERFGGISDALDNIARALEGAE